MTPITEIEFLPRFTSNSRFVREDFDTLEPGDLQWVVKGLWPRSGVCFVAGPSMSGKSFWVLDKLVNVVRGHPILNRRSKRSGVIYVAAEGALGVRRRIQALRNEIGTLGGAFEFIGQAPNLTDPDDVAVLTDTLIEARDLMASRNSRLGVVVIDTLSAATPGADENTAKDMGPVLNALQTMAIDMNLLVLIVAHTGKNEERGMRGWSGLLANADGLIMMDSPTDGARSGTVVKVKDGSAGDRFGFELKIIVLGHDEDGDEITTCQVIDTEAPVKAGNSKRWSPKLDLVMRCFNLCIGDGNHVEVPAVNGVLKGTRGVTREVLRQRMTAEGYTAGTENPESIRRAMNRTIDQLIEHKRLRANEHYVWVLYD